MNNTSAVDVSTHAALPLSTPSACTGNASPITSMLNAICSGVRNAGLNPVMLCSICGSRSHPACTKAKMPRHDRTDLDQICFKVSYLEVFCSFIVVLATKILKIAGKSIPILVQIEQYLSGLQRQKLHNCARSRA